MIKMPPKLQPIVLIEDSEDDCEAIMRAFRKSGVDNPIIWCSSGQEALDLMHKSCVTDTDSALRPIIILLDLNMPGIDGRKILETIKSHDMMKSIPVIIVSTSDNDRDIKHCYQLGASSYIQKPLDFDGLTETVRRLKEYWFDTALLPRETAYA
jgi:two-component system, response regulator